jgi:hypothetical protein
MLGVVNECLALLLLHIETSWTDILHVIHLLLTLSLLSRRLH